MRKTLTFVLLGCCIAGCSESDPVESPADTADTAIGDLGAETSTDATLPPDADGASIDADDTGDAAAPDADVAADATDADETPDALDAADVEAAIDAADGDATIDATDSSDSSDSADTSVDDVSTSEVGDASDAAPSAGEVWVVRVGDGSAALDSTSTYVFIDRFTRTGTLLGSMPLPTTASGADQRFTLTGWSWGEGTLIRSADERYVTLVGYAAAIGTDFPEFTPTTEAVRVVARIDAARTISTSTTTTAYNEDLVVAAATDDGTRFWLAGGSGISFLGGYGGAISAVTISSANVRSIALAGGALFGVKGADPKIFDFGGAVPTTSTAIAAVPGMTTGSPHQMIGLATGGSGVDLLYLCDERAATAGGGLQRWTKTSGTWSIAARLAPTTTTGCIKLAGSHAAGKTTLFALTAENPPRLVAFEDDLASTSTVTGTVIATPGANQAFRGVALEPRP